MTSRALALSALLAFTVTTQAQARPVAEIRQAKVDAASRAHAAAAAAYSVGTTTLEAVYLWSVRWLDAERASSRKAADKRAAAERHLARIDSLGADVAKRVAAGMATPTDSDAVTFYRAEAELWSTGKTH